MNRGTSIALNVTLILTALLVQGSLISAGGRQGGGRSGRLGPCSASDFTVTRFFDTLPVDLSTVSGIVPLGNTNGSSHILPISTTYFYTPFTWGGADGRQMIPDVANQPIRVPGDVTVMGLRWEPNSGGSLLAGDDWYVNFSPCDEIRFTFHHLNAVTGPPELVARAAQIRRGVNAFCEYDASGAATSCSGLAHVRLRAGTVVGRVFRMNQVSFNLTAIDKRAPTTTPAPPPGIAIDPSRYELTYDQIVAAFTAAGDPIPRAFTPELYDQLDPSRTHARCPLDYFSPVEHDALYAMLGSYDGTVHGSGCGHVFQDNPDGGLAGGWFPEGLTDPFLLGSEDILVGFLYGNVDPLRMYFSIGTSVAPPLGRTVSFPYPGFDFGGSTHNLSFKGAHYHPELPAASQPPYCWDGLVTAEMAAGVTFVPTAVSGVMLVQFTSPTRMRFEYSPSGSCAAPPPFTSAAAYFVR
jgi:hypothetical protein